MMFYGLCDTVDMKYCNNTTQIVVPVQMLSWIGVNQQNVLGYN